jgi:hypothetical protein
MKQKTRIKLIYYYDVVWKQGNAVVLLENTRYSLSGLKKRNAKRGVNYGKRKNYRRDKND